MAERRFRLSVALLIDPPVRYEIDGLRRALGGASGDRSPGDVGMDRIPPHVTLVPPVNVAAALLPAALATLRRSATAGGPLELTIGPVATFAPANPVLYLAVGGDLEGLRRVRDAAFSAPLERSTTRPWVPHVTIASRVSDERMAAALVALDHYAAAIRVDRVVVLILGEEGRRWTPLADASMGRRTVVGTGGLELELTVGRLVDPEGRALLDALAEGTRRASHGAPGWPDGCAGLGGRASVVVSGRREGRLVGVSCAWLDDAGGHVAVAVEPAARHQGVGGHLLAAVEAAVDGAGWLSPRLAAVGPAGFYRARSHRARPPEASSLGEGDG